MRKYVVIYRSVLMENLQYIGNIALGFVSYFIFIFVFINLWDYLYAEPGMRIAGYTKEQMIWYVMITEMIWFGSRSEAVVGQVTADIRGGNIAYLMNKPYHYTLYILARHTGEWCIRIPMYALFAAAIGLTMVGEIEGFGLLALLPSAISIVLGITINGIFKLCISLVSFWIEDVHPFQWMYDKLILIVGTVFPIEIFPAAMRPFMKLTPIYTVCYGPAKLVVDFHMEQYPEILSAQLLYLGVGTSLMFFLYGKGVKKLYVNGG
ncbi:ABC transporter permease [Parablautia muri]|uniref:ABC transporter permease n=1 Tax=Parablautia muri TaxID=2320879 RepID=A0A9X5GQW9_9FIRM|nr:ABC-2 family transporter protein [Parablautia muri]NBJ91734.1 ABC transporter permease [Parablautia muri]